MCVCSDVPFIISASPNPDVKENRYCLLTVVSLQVKSPYISKVEAFAKPVPVNDTAFVLPPVNMPSLVIEGVPTCVNFDKSKEEYA